ncbi:Uncharacterised protein [Salmonella enterica subsp. arizonae]|nr:Uncharacterised protein [Salmonella enterica subsp. arizonae]
MNQARLLQHYSWMSMKRSFSKKLSLLKTKQPLYLSFSLCKASLAMAKLTDSEIPHAIALGLNYPPVPLVTIGVNQRMGQKLSAVQSSSDTKCNALNSPSLTFTADSTTAKVASVDSENQ